MSRGHTHTRGRTHAHTQTHRHSHTHTHTHTHARWRGETKRERGRDRDADKKKNKDRKRELSNSLGLVQNIGDQSNSTIVPPLQVSKWPIQLHDCPTSPSLYVTQPATLGFLFFFFSFYFFFLGGGAHTPPSPHSDEKSAAHFRSLCNVSIAVCSCKSGPLSCTLAATIRVATSKMLSLQSAHLKLQIRVRTCKRALCGRQFGSDKINRTATKPIAQRQTQSYIDKFNCTTTNPIIQRQNQSYSDKHQSYSDKIASLSLLQLQICYKFCNCKCEP